MVTIGISDIPVKNQLTNSPPKDQTIHYLFPHTYMHAQQGLKVNDVLVEFGSVNHSTFKDIHDVGTVVQHSIGVS